MIRHVALFRFSEEASDQTPHHLEEGLSQLAQTIPEIEAYRYGRDLGLREGNFDFAVVADFADAEAFKRYVDHPDHQAFLKQRLSPVLAERVSIQFDL
jgi:hypothetical protein